MTHIQGKIMDVPIPTVMEWMNIYLNEVARVEQAKAMAKAKEESS